MQTDLRSQTLHATAIGLPRNGQGLVVWGGSIDRQCLGMDQLGSLMHVDELVTCC